jgi:Uma2 family endonuclease
MATTQQTAPDHATTGRRRLFTVDEYERMAEEGILGEDERVELVGGEILLMAAMGRKLAGCITLLDNRCHRLLGETALVRVQLPIMIPDYDEPEPDLAVIQPREDFYREGHPTPADVLLLIEVAVSSLSYDRDVKLPLYARAGIPESWLVTLDAEAVGRHAQPSPEGYRRIDRFGRGETIVSLTVPALRIPVDDILG